MLTKKALYIISLLILLGGHAYGQENEFCKSISAIIADAPNKFRNIRGAMTQSNTNTTIWESGIKIPGTIRARFVSSMGLFYEGALYQTGNPNELKAVYNRVKNAMDSCLTPQQYGITYQDNFYPGLQDYKKVVYMLPTNSNTPIQDAPAHITLEALYSKDLSLYTLVMYIFEH